MPQGKTALLLYEAERTFLWAFLWNAGRKLDAEQNRNLLSVKKVLDYISAHYREPLSVKELSGLSNYSEFYFMKLFKQYTGKTAAAYLNDYRLEKAKSLLLHTDASVTDIALDVGFNNTSYFIKKFQEANQLSPHKFRKKMS